MTRTKRVTALVSEVEESQLKAIGDAWIEEHGSLLTFTGMAERTKSGEMKAAIQYAIQYLKERGRLYR